MVPPESLEAFCLVILTVSYAGKSGPGDRRRFSTKINWVQIGYKLENKKSPDFSNLGFFVPEIVVTRLGVEPRTY